MTCKEKDRDTCNVEKMGCEGCAYYESDKEEGEKAKVKEKEWNLR